MAILKLYLLLLIVFVCRAQIEYSDYLDHPCKRECNGTRMKCSYEFTLERFFTMHSINCMDCLGSTYMDCFNPNCIVADGNQRLAYTVNRRIPAPTIEVCQGDIISVMIKNQLIDATTTIHWHGQHQRNTQYMDGVPMITQCPIQPNTQFLYQFIATQKGTYFYHSHSGFQRTDGISGPLIVRIPDKDNLIRDQYDFDLSGHVIQVTDWSITDSLLQYFTTYSLKVFRAINSALLINGFGSTTQNNVPIPIFEVEKGFRYRFRLIHSGSSSCPISVSIDNHNLTVISTDGSDIIPQPVEIVTVTNGERFDFIVSANQVEDYYWIRAVGSSQCQGLSSIALLQYMATNVTTVPMKDSADRVPPRSIEMNCINVPSNTPNCFTLMNITSIENINPDLKKTPDFKYVVGYKMYPFTLPVFEDIDNSIITTPAFNNITTTMPSTNLLQPGHKVKYCNQENLGGCNATEELCQCLHLVKIPENSLVELILVSEGVGSVAHPIHLHGYYFHVLAHESFGRDTTVAEVKDLDRKGLLKRNFKNPILKDTITVPAGGYSILRFRADNPGFWYMHCHLEFHMESGMAMTFQVGNPPSPPNNFPRCDDYTNSKVGLNRK